MSRPDSSSHSNSENSISYPHSSPREASPIVNRECHRHKGRLPACSVQPESRGEPWRILQFARAMLWQAGFELTIAKAVATDRRLCSAMEEAQGSQVRRGSAG